MPSIAIKLAKAMSEFLNLYMIVSPSKRNLSEIWFRNFDPHISIALRGIWLVGIRLLQTWGFRKPAARNCVASRQRNCSSDTHLLLLRDQSAAARSAKSGAHAATAVILCSTY